MFTLTQKVMIDFDLGNHSIYWATVIAEYDTNFSKVPIAIYNAKGRSLPNLLKRIIAADKIEYIEPIN